MNTILKSLETFVSNIYAFLCGVAASCIGYLFPVRDIVHLLVALFILDVAFGYWKAKRLNKEKFNVKIIWEHTMPRMLVSIVLVIGAFVWDTTYNQEFVSTYKIVGWFISGVLLYSIAENGYKITKWGAFSKIGDLFQKKIKDQTGIDIEEKDVK